MGYNRPKKKMKKIFYLLIACTMMCFAGCEEKGDEIDNTTDTGENVEINEANLVGTWKIVSYVDTITYDGYINVYADWFYEDSTRHYEYEPNYNYEGGYTAQILFWNFAFTLNADHTYEYENEYFEKENGKTYYYKHHEKENGTWSLKGKNFSIQWIEGCEEYLTTTNKADIDKPYENTYCGTYEEFVAGGDAADFSGYKGSVYLEFFYASEFENDEYYAEYSISIIKLTSTELVVQTKSYHEKDERDEAHTESTITTFKKVK